MTTYSVTCARESSIVNFLLQLNWRIDGGETWERQKRQLERNETTFEVSEKAAHVMTASDGEPFPIRRKYRNFLFHSQSECTLDSREVGEHT